MTRGEGTQSKVHYKGANDDFLVFVDDIETFKKWKEDKSVPLAHFISSFQIFITHKQGAQGNFDTASKSVIAAEFDTEDADEAIKKILTEGTVQVMELGGRQGTKNDSMGAMAGH